MSREQILKFASGGCCCLIKTALFFILKRGTIINWACAEIIWKGLVYFYPLILQRNLLVGSMVHWLCLSAESSIAACMWWPGGAQTKQLPKFI